MSLNLSRAIDDVIHGMRMAPEPEPMTGFVEGEVVAISAAGLTFTVKNWDGGKNKFGPAPFPQLATLTTDGSSAANSDNGNLVIGVTPYPHQHGIAHTHTIQATLNQPKKGDRCLAVFTDNGPWVIGWWPA